MDMFWLGVAVVSRWVHIGSAVVAVGGMVFLRFVLMPAARQLPESDHAALRERLMSRWRIIVHSAITLFLLSGLYNYLVLMLPRRDGQPLYHALLGTKILLAFVVFFIAIALTGRSAGTEMFRRDARKWLTVNVLLAAVIVAISGYVKVGFEPPAAEVEEPAPLEVTHRGRGEPAPGDS